MRNTRDRILDAAAQLLVREGADAVTIAAVAREAEVSKGGLFYHFPSKEVLVEQLVARYVASFDALVDSSGRRAGCRDRRVPVLGRESRRPSDPRGGGAPGRGGAHTAGARRPRERYRSWQARLDADGVPANVSATIRFAVDGIWLADTFDLAPIRGAARRDLRAFAPAAAHGLAEAPVMPFVDSMTSPIFFSGLRRTSTAGIRRRARHPSSPAAGR